MFGFPASTEFGKRIPKQKFYENIDITPALKRVFVEQIRLIYWRNKLAASTLNLAAGEAVIEVEVFEVRLNTPQLDEAVLRQIDKEIPYHILFILTCEGKAQAWIGYKEAAASGSNAFKVSRYYHTEWMPEDELQFRVDGLSMDAVYEALCGRSLEMRCKRMPEKAYRLLWNAMKSGGSWKSRSPRWKVKCERKAVQPADGDQCGIKKLRKELLVIS